MTVQKDEDLPMPGLKVYLFNAAGTYLGRSATTDAFGQVEFSVPEDVYKLRVDYLGYQFWSEEVLVAEDTVMEMPIIHRQVEITAQGSFQGMPAPIEGIKVYLFSPTDTYLGQHQINRQRRPGGLQPCPIRTIEFVSIIWVINSGPKISGHRIQR